MKEKGITDTNLVKVEPLQSPKIELKKEVQDTSLVDYWATLTYKDTAIVVAVKIPDDIKQHSFEIDTLENRYVRKIIYPKGDLQKGLTGIYFKALNSNFNFNLYGKNLTKVNREKAIKAFRTIKIIRK